MGISLTSSSGSSGYRPVPLGKYKGIAQEAVQTALKFNRNEVDTKHLLYAISNSDVVKEIYKQFKVNPNDVKNYIEANTPKGLGKIKKGWFCLKSISIAHVFLPTS